MCQANGWRRLATVVAGLVLLGLVGPFWADEVKVGGRDSRDKAIHAGLRDAINQGAALFNDYGDYSGCYRVFHGALLSVKPLLAHHPQLQKTIDDGMARAEKNPRMPARAWILRKVLDEVRTTLVPLEPGKKEEKKAEEKKIEEKKKEVKKTEEKKKETKKVEKKTEDKKTEDKKMKKVEKKTEEKKTEEKKTEEKKKVVKKPEEKKPVENKEPEEKKTEEKKKTADKEGEEKKEEPKKKAAEKKKEEKKKDADKKAEFIDLKSALLEEVPTARPGTSVAGGREESGWFPHRLWGRKTEG